MKRTFVMLGLVGLLSLAACGGTPSNEIEDIFDDPSGIPYSPSPDVLGEAGIDSGPLLITPEDMAIMWDNMFDPDTVQIIVNGETINNAPTPFIDREIGVVMLPLVAIAESLGYITVVDNAGDVMEVVVGPGTMVTEGVNSYARGREMARELLAAPVVVNDVMFVPEDFFYHILGSAAFIVDGNIIVNDIE